MTARIFALCIAATVCASSLWAEVSAHFSSYSGAYENIEKLEALGCAYPTFRALGPQTSADLRSALDWDPATPSCHAPEWLLDERQLLVQPKTPVEIRVDGFSAVDDRVTLPGLPATLWPLFAQRQNRLAFSGLSLSHEATLAGQAGGQTWGYAGSVTPGFFWGVDQGNVGGRFYLQEGHIKIGYGFSELSFGRYARRFGDTKHGSLLYSGATAPIDVLEFALRPYVMDGWLSHLGPVSVRTWLGNQGDSGTVRGTRLWGVELGMRPFQWWEVAVAEVFQFGGVGVSPLSWGEALTLPLGGGFGNLGGRRHFSLAVNNGFWVHRRFAKVYGQALWNRLGEGVVPPFSYQVGAWFPDISRWDLRIEFARTAAESYQHPVWTQGLTYAGSTMGHPLGPDGEGVYLDVGLPPLWTWWHGELGALYERRRLNPGAGQGTETRWGASLGMERRWGLNNFGLKLAYHQINGAQFNPGLGKQVFGAALIYRYTFLY